MDRPQLADVIEPAALQDAAETVASLQRPLLLSHTKPDGDALGALLAMRAFCRGCGADPLALQFDPTPKRYVALRQQQPMAVWNRDVSDRDLREVDGVIVLDTCTYNQLAPLAEWLAATDVPKVVADHHVTQDDIATTYVRDPSASATCLILYEWARVVGWDLPLEACEALFIGIATDTGWFRHANTDARTLRAAAELVARGADASALHRKLYQTDSVARLRLLGELLQTLRLHADDRLAVLTLRHEMLDRLEAVMSDAEDMVNEPLRIGSVLVSVLLTEQVNGPVRVSLRSKEPAEAGAPDVDVAAIAQDLGGGGHKRAAGVRVPGTLESVAGEVIGRVEPLLG